MGDAVAVRGGSRLPLAWRIFLLCAGLVALAIGTAVAVTYVVGQRLAQEQIDVSLARSAEARDSHIEQRLRLLERTIQLIGSDPALINYTATALDAGLGLGEDTGTDIDSLRDLLEERQTQFGFDLGLVLDAEAYLVARSDQGEAFADPYGQDPMVGAAIESLVPQSGFWLNGGDLYQATVLPMTQGRNLVGYLLLAQRVDADFAQAIARIAGSEVAFWLPVSSGVRLIASSLPPPREAALAQQLDANPQVIAAATGTQPAGSIELRLDGNAWLAQAQSLSQAGVAAPGASMLLVDRDAMGAGWQQIMNLLLLSGGVALLLSLPLSLWLSRRILRPARALAEAAEHAAAGDFDSHVAISGSDELARLGWAIDSLLSGLREKRDIEGYMANFSRFVGDDRAAAAAPAAAAPREAAREVGSLIAAEWLIPSGQANAAMQLLREAECIAALAARVRAYGGLYLAGDGQRALFGVFDEDHFAAALAITRDALSAADGKAPTSMALGVADVVHGDIALDGQRRGAAVAGGGAFQLQRLLCEAPRGAVLLNKPAADAAKQRFGASLVEVLEGAASKRRFHALGISALADAALPLPHVASGDVPTVRLPAIEVQVGVSPPQLSPGMRLGGRYEILSQLGAGGMGVVYKARDIEIDDIVALKLLRPGALSDAESLERLKDEIRLARRITHPNVLRTFDFGEAEGRPFISMEFVRGVTLRDLLDQSGKLPYSAGLRIARQFCAGLAAAHEVGVLHRDIKPENVILEASGNAKLMDFGIARPVRRQQPGQTQPGMYIGTPHYSSPEQLAGNDIDERSDIFSTGVMLFELFCGGLPFTGGNTIDIYMAQTQSAPVLPSDLWPEVPDALQSIILRCIAVRPEERYQRIAELEAELALLRA